MFEIACVYDKIERMTSLLLKFIAIITMLLDHLSYALPERVPLLNSIGRIAFPIFAFLIAQGYIHTKNLKKYLVRLLIFAVVSQLPFMLLLNMIGTNFGLNIYVTLALGLLAIITYDKIKPKVLGIMLAILITFVGDIVRSDYGTWGVLLILLMYIFAEYLKGGGDRTVYVLSFSSVFAFMVLFMYSFSLNHPLHFVGYTISLLIILSYNGKPARNMRLFKSMKFVFYAFYPVHLVVLYLLSLILK